MRSSRRLQPTMRKCFICPPIDFKQYTTVLPLCPATYLCCRNSFCVGQVKATGQLRVSSTAPYFVDDRLHCPEVGMKDSKPLHLCVSLAPEVASQTPTNQAEAELAVKSAQSASPKIPTHPGTATTNGAGARVVLGSHPAEGEGVPEHPARAQTGETLPATQPQGAADGSPPTPWVLDICLVSSREHVLSPPH